MSIKQKVSDLVLLVKSERRFKWIIGIGLAALLFLYFNGGRPQHVSKINPAKSKSAKSQTIANEEAYKDIVGSLKADQDKMMASIKASQDDAKEMDKKLDNYQERTAEIFKKILERMADSEMAKTQQVSASATDGSSAEPVDIGASEPGAAALAVDNLDSFGDMTVKEAPPAPPQLPGKVAFIGAGDSVSVKLIAGVRAPTDGTPYPVLFQLTGDVQGPDGSTLPLGEARLIGAAQGSLVDSRVLFRITKLNLRMPDGRRKVIDVDGWVVGEDGLRGMQGIPIDPIGKSIAAGGMIGALGALGEGLSRSTSTVTSGAFGNTNEIVTGDLGTYAAGKGMSGFTKEWGRIVAERAHQLVPHVEVYSGREGTAVFAQSVAIRGLFEELNDEDNTSGGGSFASLE